MNTQWKVSVMTCAVLAASGAVACTGQLGGVEGDGPDAGSGTDNGSGNGSGSKGVMGDANDPGFKGIHRLNTREYNNTIRDLLGASYAGSADFLNESGHSFDNDAASLSMTTSQYRKYFDAATTVAADVFADPTMRAQMMTCDTGAPDEICAQEIIHSFGHRALRRPLLAEEVATFLGVYQRAVALQLDHPEATEQVLRTFLSSAEFLYRMEFDEDPSSATPHPVSQYELASRLSYYLWSTTPDENLMSLAAQGTLEGEVLSSTVDVMMADPRSDSLVDSFAWQWLGFKRLESHKTLTDVLPEWDDALKAQMLTEARNYLMGFVRHDRSWNEFLTSDSTFADAGLADYYGGDPSQRFGFLGLGGFLTTSSFAHRTAPTLRAKWILEELLCDPPPPPPVGVNIPDLDAEVDGDELANQAAALDNVRERLELHRSDPGCANCHANMDPLGMALENFDAIGRYRDQYVNGDTVDPTGAMPDGTPFDGLPSLAIALQGDDRFLECATEKTLTYAIGRSLGKDDEVHVAALNETWQDGGANFNELVKLAINSVPFQMRRGGSE